MSTLTNIAEKLYLPFFNDKERSEYPSTFREELNHQSARLLFLTASIMTFAWLPYISIDRILHPDEPVIVALRLGLSLTGIVTLALHLSGKFRKHSLTMLTAAGAYFVVATGLLTALSGGDIAYVGGYLFVITMVAVVPVRRRAALIILYSSVAVFFGVGFFKGMDFKSMHAKYSLNDIITAVFVATVFIILLDRMRLRGWEKSRKIASQKEELKSDKRKIDKLLLNILPAAVAHELKEKGHVKPVFHKSATIVFTDFVGFTKISEKLSPEELVNELDSLFSVFDGIMDKYSLEKLKTIGDAYMYAGGVPIATSTHAIDAVLAAIEIQDHMNSVNKKKKISGDPVFELRTGINTGAIMAGVVGEKKFVYDVWGNSVNFASKMESAGETGQVNISRSTYELVKDFYEIEERGHIAAKNTSAVEMFFVKRIKQNLSLDEKGIIPNELFWDMYVKVIAREIA